MRLKGLGYAGLGGVGTGGAGRTDATLPRQLQAVTLRNEVDRARGAATTSANLKQVCRMRDYFGSTPSASITPSINNFYIADTTGVESDGAAYVARMDVEINGICVVCTFDGGASSKTIAAGAVDVQADPMLPAMFGLTEFPANMEYYTKLEREYIVGAFPCYITLNDSIPAIPGEITLRAASGTATKIGTPGPMAAGDGWNMNATARFKPLMLGVPKAAMPAVLILGASIEFGTADTEGDGVNGAGGYCRIGLASGTKIAGMNMGKSGDSARNYVQPGNSAKRSALFKYFNIGVNGYSGNDFTDNRSISNVVADMATVNASMKAGGIEKIAQIINFVKSDSTDAWATVANQTVKSNANGTLLEYRNACLAATDQNRTTFFDLRSVMEAAPSIWKAPPTYTADGIHPGSNMHALMATSFRTQIDALISGLLPLFVPNATYLPAGAGTPLICIGARKYRDGSVTPIIQIKKGGPAGPTYDVPTLWNGLPDFDGAALWADGAETRISIGYNEGSLGNFVPPDWASMPLFDPAGLYGPHSKYGALFSWIFDGWFQTIGSVRRIKWASWTGLNTNRRSLTIFDIVDPKSSISNAVYWDFATAAAPTVTSLSAATTAARNGLYIGGFSDDETGRRPRQNMQVIAVNSGAVADKVLIDGQVVSLPPKGSVVEDKFNLGVGASGAAGTSDFLDSGNRLGLIVYGTSLSDANALAVRDALNATLGLVTTFDNQITLVGDSILFGGNIDTGLEGRNPNRVAAPKLRGRNAINNMGLSSQLLTGPGGLAANAAMREDLLAADGNYSKRILVIQIGSNDLGVNGNTPGFSSTLYSALTTYIAGRRAAGYTDIVVCTILPAASTGSGQPLAEYLAYNALVRNNAAGADAILDLASHPIMGNRANLGANQYYQDSLHPTGLGYSLIGATGAPVAGLPVNYADAINSRLAA